MTALVPRLDGKSFALLLAIALATAFVLYAPSIQGGFVFDDRYQFYSQPQPPTAIGQYLTGPRAATQATYLLNHQLTGADPAAFHRVNLVLHALNAVLLSGLVWRLLGLADWKEPRRAILALTAGGLLLTHAAMSEAVIYVAARTDLLCTAFMLLAAILYVDGRDRPMSWVRALGLSLCFGLAVASKEQAAGLPLIFLALEWVFRQRWGGIRQGGVWKVYAILGAVGLAGGALIWSYARSAKTVGAGAGVTPWEYFFTQWRSLGRYLQLYVFPIDLNLDYDWKPSRSPLDENAWLWLLLLLALGGFLWWKRDRPGLQILGAFIALVILAPTTSFLPIQDLVSERRIYTPMIGVALLGVVALGRSRLSDSALAWTAIGICALLGFLTWQRAQVWSHPALLWQDTARKSPQKFRPHYWLASSLLYSGNCAAAAGVFEAASKLSREDDSESIDREHSMAYDCSGRPDLADAAIDRELALRPQDADARALKGRYLAKQGKMTSSLEQLDWALRLAPNHPLALGVRGQVLLSLSRFDEAIRDLEQAVQLNPRDRDSVLALDRARRLIRRPN